jgi:hypothetical protein
MPRPRQRLNLFYYGDGLFANRGLFLDAHALGDHRPVAKTGLQLDIPWLHHVKGELLLARNPSDGANAEHCFRAAIETARLLQRGAAWALAEVEVELLRCGYGALCSLTPTDPHVMVVPLVDFTASGKNGKTSVPVLDFVTIYVTGMVDNNNTVVATVIPPLATCSTPTTTSSHPAGTGLKAVLCSDSGCPSAAAWPSM